jgi:hypothetical protein
MSEFSDALGAGTALPVTGLTVYTLRQQIVRLEADIERYREEIREYQWLTGRLTLLLTMTANALKGEPDELHLHDWSDLPAVARRLVANAE